MSRQHGPLTIVAGCVAPVLYLLFVNHYAVNSFQDDDWTVVPIVHAALHGRLSFSLLWSQYHESRLFLGNLVDVLFGFIDRLDLRALILFDVVVFIAAYAIILVLVREYRDKRLTPIPALAIGVAWFSLADVQNELWAFQVSWYLTVLFFIAMLYALLVPGSRRSLWIVIGVILAVAASLSTVQGFICWPIGAICILWPPRSRQVRPELTGWLGATLITMAAYLSGYKVNETNSCIDPQQCTIHYELHHLPTTFGFFFALIGNVIPGPANGPNPTVTDPTRFVLVGVALFVIALFILVQSWRRRTKDEKLPVPGLLIVFALLFDATIAVGRGGSGVSGAVIHNRYVMANLILLTAIVVFGLARVSAIRSSWLAGDHRLAYSTGLGLLALAVFFVVQVSVATSFGFTNGQATRISRIGDAQYFVIEVTDLEQGKAVHYDRKNPTCAQIVEFLSEPLATLHDVAQDRMGEFNPGTLRFYHSLSARLGVANCLG